MNDILQDAAIRCTGYFARHGLILKWSIHPLGLQLGGSDGNKLIDELLPWHDVRTSPRLGLLMTMVEEKLTEELRGGN